MSQWQNRIVEYGTKPASQFTGHPNNPRRHPKTQSDATRASIDTLGWYDVVIENKRTGYIIDGHDRLWLALEQGDDTPVPYILVDLSEDEEALALVSHDWITTLAQYDRDVLKSLMEQVHTDNPVLQQLITEQAEAQGIVTFDEPATDPGAQVERADELQKLWQVERGQVWRIGQHRLMCGDSTSAEDVARLMGGELCTLVTTDPPYGVDYSEKNTFLNAIARGNRIQTPIINDSGSKDDIQEVWKSAFKNMSDAMRPGAVVYCFMPQGGDQMMMMMMMMMMGAGIEPRHELIWLKNNHVLGRVDYAYKHEPILYAWKEGGHKFYGDFQTSIIEVDKPLKSDLHPTMKPVELIVILVNNSSLRDEIVYDPFCGSGTTLVACEQTGRRGYGMEISPEYCAVILQRLSDMNLKPELET